MKFVDELATATIILCEFFSHSTLLLLFESFYCVHFINSAYVQVQFKSGGTGVAFQGGFCI